MPVPMSPKNGNKNNNNKGFNWGRFSKTLSFWVFILLIPVVLIQLAGPRSEATTDINYTQYRAQLTANNIQDVTVSAGKNITGTFRQPTPIGTKSAKRFSLQLPVANSQAEIDQLTARGVTITGTDAKPNLLSVVVSFLPWLLLIGFYLFLFRQMQSGGAKAFSFGKSKAKLLTGDTPKVTFADVAGADEAKQELQEIIEFLKDPQKYTRLGGRLPKGCLLVGPPGTGKTLLARAVAGEAGRPFFSMSGSDFVEMFVGVGASRVRDLFEQGKAHAPCIIFIDEIDAVGRHRGAGLGGGHDEREQTLNQLLVEMDGFESNEGVILIAATNRPDVLDPALLRPGRFDRQVVVPNPDVVGREQILRVHVRKVPLAPDINLKTIARGTRGFSGADLMNLVNEAALTAARRNKRMVTQAEFEDAKDKVMMGAERKSLVMTEEEKMLTAYHEGGHAIVGLNVIATDPIHKATIIPRGRALGMVMQLPERDKLSMSRIEIKAMMVSLFGGRVAEQLIFGDDRVTTGASDDIRRATGLARRMVTEFGMSEKLGPLRYSENEEEVFLGHSVTQRKNVSDETAKLIDQEVRRIVEGGESKAREILSKNLDGLHIVAKALLEYETLSGDEVQALLRGEKIRQASGDSDKPKPRSSVPTAGATVQRPTGLEPRPQPGG